MGAAAPTPGVWGRGGPDRKRREAEARNARHRRTRELRSTLARTEAEAAATERELAQVMERLADPAIYADAALVKKLVERHNELRDRTETVGPELDGLRAELAGAEEPQLVRSE